jgi:hypothetical protein
MLITHKQARISGGDALKSCIEDLHDDELLELHHKRDHGLSLQKRTATTAV